MLKKGAAMPLKSTNGGAADAVSVALTHCARSAGSDHEAMVVPPTAFVMRPIGGAPGPHESVRDLAK